MLGLLAILLCARAADEDLPDDPFGDLSPGPADPSPASLPGDDLALAADDLEPAAEAVSWRLEDLDAPAARPPARVHLVPLRLDLRAPIRSDVGFGLVTALGLQLTRTEKTTFDLDFAYTSGRILLVPGPLRSFLTFEVSGQTNTTVSRWLGLGVVGGAWLRAYRQQFTSIDESFVPMVGVRGESALVRARRWSAVVSARLTTDLVLTRIVLEDSRVSWMSPLEAQLGLRLHFGHGRPPEAR